MYNSWGTKIEIDTTFLFMIITRKSISYKDLNSLVCYLIVIWILIGSTKPKFLKSLHVFQRIWDKILDSLICDLVVSYISDIITENKLHEVRPFLFD